MEPPPLRLGELPDMVLKPLRAQPAVGHKPERSKYCWSWATEQACRRRFDGTYSVGAIASAPIMTCTDCIQPNSGGAYFLRPTNITAYFTFQASRRPSIRLGMVL